MSIVNNDFYAKIESNLLSNNYNLVKEVKLPEINKDILLNMYNIKKNNDYYIENFKDKVEEEAEAEAEAEDEEEEEDTKPTPAPKQATTPAPTQAPTPAVTRPIVKNYKVNKEVQKLQLRHNERVLDHCKVRCLKKLEDYKQNKEGFENNSVHDALDNLRDKIKSIVKFII
jgi:hypothetical protein